MMRTALYRPEPVSAAGARPQSRRADPGAVARRLLAGDRLVAQHYGAGVAALDRLQAMLAPRSGTPKQRAILRWRETASRLLAPIRDHRPALDGAPPCGFLGELYPERADFVLSLADLRDLCRAWRLYDRGVHMAVLGHALHPLYGVYLPSRTEHLELLATWLSGYEGPRGLAIDVGAGSGVLAFMLCRAGFARVLATDISPNAVESLRRELARRPAPITPALGDLLEPAEEAADLIVFNPPWTPGVVDSPLDRSLYYEEGLFERFFDQAAARLAPGGRVVLVFSNLIRLVLPGATHPIEAELERGRLQLVEKMQRKVKSSKKRRTRERVAIWVLAAR